VKCGVSQYLSRYCTTMCCDWKVDETCYNDIWEPVSCQRYDNDELCPLPTTTSLNNSIASHMVRVNYSNGEGEEEGNVFT